MKDHPISFLHGVILTVCGLGAAAAFIFYVLIPSQMIAPVSPVVIGPVVTSSANATWVSPITTLPPPATPKATEEDYRAEEIAATKARLPYIFPNSYDDGKNDVRPNASSTLHLLSIPFHTSRKVLRVYTDCAATSTFPGLYAQSSLGDCANRVDMVVYDPTAHTSVKIGTFHLQTGGNYGGIQVPRVLTTDDRHIILDAWMGDPGAGGGSVDFGYSIIPIAPAHPLDADADVKPLARRPARFYAAYDKVVYPANSQRSPQYSQPGPDSNDGALIYKDILAGTQKTILEEADTSFAITGLDEKAKTLTLEVTKYRYTKDCPRADDAELCAEKTTSTRMVPLP